MMRRSDPPIALLVMVALGCSQPRTTPVPHARTIVQANGQVTPVNAGNAPEVVPLSPEHIVHGGPFVPVNDGARAIAHATSYTTDNGLPMDDITCAHLSAIGMLWFGTNGGGISRFDGRSFTNYTMAHGLPDNTILSIGGDSKGNIWIGTSTGGLCRYDGRCFRSMGVNDAKGLASGFTCMLEDKDGTLWFGSRGRGLYRYDGARFTHIAVLDSLGHDHVRALVRTADGTLWASTYQGLARYDGRSFTPISEDGRSLRDVETMVAITDGDLWLGHAVGGLTRCALEGDRPRLVNEPLIPGDEPGVGQMLDDGSGGLWIASTTHGAIHYRPDSTKGPPVTRLSMAEGMPSNELLCLVNDRQGDLWFGTRGAGLTHYRGEAFTCFRGFKPISIAEDPSGTLWVGTANGLARSDGGQFSEQRNGTRDAWNYAVSVDPSGRVGFGRNMADPSRPGISWFDGHDYHVTDVPDDRPWVDIFWTLHDRRRRLWVGGRRGVEAYANGHRTSYTTEQGLGSNLVLCLAEDHEGAIWAGTDGGGISRLDSTSVTTWTTGQGLPNNVVWSVVQQTRGTTWIATLRGIARFDGHSMLTYTTQDGLPDDNINQALLAKDEDALFLGTLNGLAAITGWRDASGELLSFQALDGLPNDSVAHYAPVIEVYNTGTGFPVKDVQTAEHTLFEDSKGILWVATGSDKTGLVRIDRKAMRKHPEPLDVKILSVSLNNEPTCWYDLGDGPADSLVLVQQETMSLGGVRTADERARMRDRYRGLSFSNIAPHFPVPQDLVLDHRNNHISFVFVGVETARPEVVEYRTKLEGYDPDWSPATRSNTASFGNIQEGDYTFKVVAKSPDGIWSEPLAYQFSVLPPMHRTWWAYVLYVLVAAGAIILVIRRRTAALQHQKMTLERTVAERTEQLRRKKEEADEQRDRAELSEKAKERFLANMSHEIRTPMNAIMGMSDILKDRPHSPEQAKYLSAIAQSSENLLIIINDILDLTKIDAGRINFESVPFDVRAVIGNVQDIVRFKADQKGIAVEVRIDDRVPGQLLGDPTRLNQIVMNLAGNAVKFTERGSVYINVHRSSDPTGRPGWLSLVIEVVDTGIGIPEDRIEKIFEEFTQAYSDTTRKYGGTGLGLTISKRLTELQGGTIKVTSQRGKGSTFTVTIPYPIAEEGAADVARSFPPFVNDL